MQEYQNLKSAQIKRIERNRKKVDWNLSVGVSQEHFDEEMAEMEVAVITHAPRSRGIVALSGTDYLRELRKKSALDKECDANGILRFTPGKDPVETEPFNGLRITKAMRSQRDETRREIERQRIHWRLNDIHELVAQL